MLQEENRRILKAVDFVNLQRCDRMTMAHSLEARVPFFDVNNLEAGMAINPEDKLITEERNMSEKWLLRKMFEDMIPAEVCWRTKAMQCEGVGMTWVKTLQDHISSLVSDEDFAQAAETYPKNPPHSKEEYYYRSVFEKYYPGCDKFVHVWEGGCRAGGAAFQSKEYTRAGLSNTELLKKGHGGAQNITV
jgi:asparagine synthase (glutamine-hydrolysing)